MVTAVPHRHITRFMLIRFFLLYPWAATGLADAMEEVLVIGEQDSYFEKSRATALKMNSEDLETPFSTSVINSAVLEDLKASTLETAYGYLTGFARSGTNANAFTIRGQAADLQNIQVDGLPGLASRFGSPVTANVERMEVLKGPASVLYGWMDPGGMVNIVTKKPQAQSSTSIDITGQYFTGYNKNGLEGSLDSTGSLNEGRSLLYRVVSGLETLNSFRDYVESESTYLFPSLAWLPDDQSRLDVQFEYLKQDRNADNGLWVINQDINTLAEIETYYQEPGDTDNDEGYGVSVAYQRTISDQLSAHVKWRSIWHEDERDLYESNSLQTEAGETTLRRRNRHQLNKREYHFADANLIASTHFGLPQTFILGFNGGYEYRQYDRIAFDTRGANLSLVAPQYTGRILSDDPGTFRQWNLYSTGFYAMDRITLSQHWTLLVGARWDKQSGDYQLRYIDVDDSGIEEDESAQNVSVNGGVVYRVNDQLSFYASFAESFNPQAIPSFDVNGDQLDPEQGEQWEAGFKFESVGGRLNLNMAYFDVLKKNIVEEGESGANELIGEVSSQGLEVTLQAQPSVNFQFMLGYTYTDAEISQAYADAADTLGNPPGFVPKNTAFAMTRYNYPEPVWGGFVGASFGWKYQDERYTDEETSRRVLLPSHRLMDIGFYYEVNNAKYALNIANLSDETYYVGGTNDTRIYPGDPRKVSLSARFDF
ncbi:TonB-dependent siderophore receptor [Halioxenophilus aromaticivorans]|uniref:TonB-dependent siderophore receptor n=1 Tax=Halioxenophilus aromaticivorans TaxID=1306992 RepID=A0AAV3U1K1_9ALTE